jgi:putative ABC transport system permease protein
MSVARSNLHERLKEGGRNAGGAGRSRLRNGLVVAEMAIALMLLVGGGLLIKSFWLLQRINPGFNPEHLLTMALAPPTTAYQSNEQIAALYERVFEKVRALPGVVSVASTSPLMLTGDGNDTMMQIEGRPFNLTGANLSTNFSIVSPDYFQTMGVRMISGRLPNYGDREGALPVAVISESIARTHWPNEDPVGKRVRLLDAPPESATTRYMTIVGVVADVKNQGLNAAPRQEMYVPLAQQASTGFPVRSMAIAIRTAPTIMDPLSLANTVRQTIWSLDRNIPISAVQTMEQVMALTVAQQRFNAAILGIFALIALGLSAAGIYGVISYSVSQRTQEIGIRMALGAQTGDVLRMVLKQGMGLAIVGVAIGVAGAIGLTRLMASMLFEVSTTDAFIFVSVSALLAIVALMACYVPARRAMHVDPMIALRCE